jgi:hypothetical protein
LKVGPRIGVLFTAAWAGLGCTLATASPSLVSNVPLPDPQVLQVEGEWCIFGTGAEPFLLHGDELKPDRMRRKALRLDYGGWPHAVHQVWGFTVHRHDDGAYHGYGTLHLGEYRTVVAHFEPAAGQTWRKGDPIARWGMTKVLLGDVASRDWNYYESKVVRDGDGPLHLVYCWNNGRNQNEIRAQRMRDPSSLDRRFEAQTLLRPDGYRSEDRNAPGGLQLVEGASVARVAGKWILFYSVGDYALATYKLGVAYSDALVPPRGELYQKVLHPDSKRIWRNEGRTDEVAYLLQSTHPEWPNYCARSVVGPGLGSLVVVGGSPRLVFHGYRPDDARRDPNDRFVWTVPVRISISPDTPMLDWIRPVL